MDVSDIKIIDLHSDIWVDVADKRDSGETRVFETRHMEMLKQNNVKGLVYSLFTYEQKHLKRQESRFIEMLAAHFADLAESRDTAFVTNWDEYQEAVSEDKFILIGMVEGLYGANCTTDMLYLLQRLGIRVLGLVWNEDNKFAAGSANPDIHKGLSPQGLKALKTAQELNMIIDVSHMSEAAFWDVEKNTHGVFIASHSNCYSLCPDPRNLKDKQIKAIAKHGGIVGLVAWPDFVDSDNPSLDKLVDHAVYIADLVGPEHVAFGFDFAYWSDTWNKDFSKDGKVKAVKGLEDVNGISALLQMLEKRGFTQDEIKNMASDNFLRVFKKVCG